MGLHAPREQVRLTAPGLGADSTLVGAAEQAFGPLLFDPPGTLAMLALSYGGITRNTPIRLPR